MRPRRVDANHAAIRDAMRDEGLTVADLSGVGGGIPDTVAGYEGQLMFVEIKDGSKPPSRRKLTPAQVKFHAAWRDAVVVLENEEQARAFARGLRNYKATLLAAAQRAGSGRDM